MKTARVLVLLAAVMAAAGCATTDKKDETKAELEQARTAAIKVAQSFADYKKQAAEETEKLKQQAAASAAELEATRQEAQRLKQQAAAEIEELQRERARVAADLETAKQDGARAAAELQTDRQPLATSQQSPPSADVNVALTVITPPELTDKLTRLESEVAQSQQDRQRLEQKAADLEERLRAKLAAEAEAPAGRQEDPIRITIVDRLLFESGEVELKAVGCKVLKQFGEKLKRATDRQIRVEGHTDNKLPKPKLQARYPTNWELSTARAINVVRCLIKEGGVPPSMLSAVGYADSRPVASNETEDGRRKNRRVEIVLYPRPPAEAAMQPAQ